MKFFSDQFGERRFGRPCESEPGNKKERSKDEFENDFAQPWGGLKVPQHNGADGHGLTVVYPGNPFLHNDKIEKLPWLPTGVFKL